MVSLDKEKNRRLKEASSLYEKSLKAFQKGEITKEQLKERLRPYKYELRELGYPVKIRDDETPSQAPSPPTTVDTATSTVKDEHITEAPSVQLPLNVDPWSRRSQLTIEEVEKRIDSISLTNRPSEKLQSMYQSRYGEDLEPPLDLVPYSPQAIGQAPAPSQTGAAQGSPTSQPVEDGATKRPFWKGLLKGRRRA